MTKPRRRQAGEGGISEYTTKAGRQYLVKYTTTLADGSSKVVLRRRDNDGKPFLTRKAAADYLGDVNSEIRRGTHVVPSRVTTGEWLDLWLSSLRLAPSTVASYRKNVRLHIRPALGTVPLAKLTGTRISAHYRDLESSGRQDHEKGTGLSARTVRYVHTILKSALREAVSQGLLAANPAEKAKPPAAREAKAPEIHPWTADELKTFLGWAEGQDRPDFASWHLLAFTGMRRGEMLALRWRDVDFEQSRVSVRRSVGIVRNVGEGAEIVEGATKTGRDRVVDLDPSTLEVLKRHRLARAGLALQLSRPDALVFGDLNGVHQHPERYSRRFAEQLARCNRDRDPLLPQVRVHDLRHTHATLLLKAGIPVKVVSERLGHATVTITMETYQHVMPGMQQDAAAKFAAIVGGT